MGNMRNIRTKRRKLKTNKRKSFKRLKTKNRRNNKNTRKKIYYGGYTFWAKLGMAIFLLGLISIVIASGVAGWTASVVLSGFLSTAGKVLHERFLDVSENKSVDSVDVKDYMKAIWGTGVTKIIKSLYDNTEIESTLSVFTVYSPIDKGVIKYMKVRKDDWINNEDLKEIFKRMRYSTPFPNESQNAIEELRNSSDENEWESFFVGLQIKKLRNIINRSDGKKKIYYLLYSIFINNDEITEVLNKLVKQSKEELWKEVYGEKKNEQILSDSDITLDDDAMEKLNKLPLMEESPDKFHLLPLLYKIEPKSLHVDFSEDKKHDRVKVLEMKIDNEKNLLIGIKSNVDFSPVTPENNLKITLQCGRFCKTKGLLKRTLQDNRKLGGVLFSERRFTLAKKEVLRYCNKNPQKVGTLDYLLEECSSVDSENIQWDPPISGMFESIPSLDWISSDPPHIREFLRAISEYENDCRIKDVLYNMLNYTENNGKVELDLDIFNQNVMRFINNLSIKKESSKTLETSKYKEKINRYLFEVSRFWNKFYKDNVEDYCAVADTIFN